MHPSIAIARKDLRVLSRDRLALFWTLGFPVLFGAFFGSAMKTPDAGESSPLPIALVAEPGDKASVALAANLVQAGLRVRRATPSAAIEAVQRGDAVAYVRMPRAGTRDPFELGIDPSRRAETALVRGALAGAIAPELHGPATAAQPRITSVRVQGVQATAGSGYQLVFPAMVLWGLLGCSATFAVSIVAERGSGTLLRLAAAPVSRISIVGGKALSCVVACAVDVALLSALGMLVLGVRVGDAALYVATVAAVVLCFSGLTMAMATLGKTEQSVAGAGWALLLGFAMLGGAMVPLSVMPAWLQRASVVSPVKWGISALEGATFRALGWDDLLPSLGALTCAGVLALAFSVAALSARELR